MSTYLISRHPAAIEWIQQQTQVDRVIEHFDIKIIQAGDTVIGTLPVHLAEQVCERSASNLHLKLTVPEELRGIEFALPDLKKCLPKISDYYILERSHV